jgi:hypothetical protein
MQVSLLRKCDPQYERGREKEGNSQDECGWYSLYTRMNIEFLQCWNHHKKGTKVEWKPNRGYEPIGVIIYTWRYHKETPCVATFIYFIFNDMMSII